MKEKYEQQLVKMEVECENQEERRLEAEARVRELEDEMEVKRIEAGARIAKLGDEVMELQGEIEDIFENY